MLQETKRETKREVTVRHKRRTLSENGTNPKVGLAEA